MATAKQDSQATAQADDARDSKTRRGDVLVYNARKGACSCMWNEEPQGASDKRVRIPQQRHHRIEPGLSFVPGDLWEAVQGSSTWTHGHELGTLKPVAGHRGELAPDWAKTRRGDLRPMIRDTFGVAVLLRLQDLEAAGPRRPEVADDLDARLGELKVRRAEFDRKRNDQRRRNRHRASA
jgi:hypothetical protein